MVSRCWVASLLHVECLGGYRLQDSNGNQLLRFLGTAVVVTASGVDTHSRLLQLRL